MKVRSINPRLLRARVALTYVAVILLIILADSFFQARCVVLCGPSQAYAICSDSGHLSIHLAPDIPWERQSPWVLRCGALSTGSLTQGPEYDSAWTQLGIFTTPNRIPWFEGSKSWESIVVL